MDKVFQEQVERALDLNPTVQDAINWALNVIDGSELACKYVRWSCLRFYNDMVHGQNRGLLFVPEKAATALAFFPSFCTHVKGELAGQPIVLAPHEAFIIINLFGWYKWDIDEGRYTRRFTRAYDEVARKNNKSTLSSGIGLFMLGADGEGGAEVYAAATKKDQAKIVFDAAAAMAKKSPLLSEIKVHKTHMEIESNNSVFRPLSRDADSLDGLNSHCNIVDELHAHKFRDLWDVLITGTGSRLNPLTLAITTAGFSKDGICFEQRQIIIRILDPDDEYEDDTYFGIIFTLDEDDDPFDETAWPKANPNLGRSKKIRDMRSHAKEAQIGLLAKLNFLVKHLNVWSDVAGAWLDLKHWKALAGDLPDDIESLPMWVGYDYAPEQDITAIIRLYVEFETVTVPIEKNGVSEMVTIQEPKHLYIKTDFYFPEIGLSYLPERIQNRVKQWGDKGFINITPGAQMRNSILQPVLMTYGAQENCKELCMDPWNTREMTGNLDEEGVEVMHIGQTVRNFSDVMKKLEAMIHDKAVTHDGNPVMNWMMGNVEVAPDRNDNIFPRKAGEKKHNKIDGATALFTAMNRALINGGETPSAYEDSNFGL